MATAVKLKRSSVSGRVPTTSDLDYGELAINYTDKKLYFKDNTNTIITVDISGASGGAGITVSGTAPSSPTNGQGWVDLNTGILYFWVDDGSSSQWVEFGTAGGGGGGGGSTATVDPIIVSTTTTYTAAQTSGIVVLLCNSTSGAITINLPTAVLNKAIFTVKKIDSSTNTVTIDASGAETIDGSTTIPIAVCYTAITFVSDGSNWMII